MMKHLHVLKTLLVAALLTMGAKQADARLLDYPYTWDPATAQTDFHFSYFWGLGWQWDENYQAIYMSGKSTNWMGSITSDTFNFPAGEPVMCTFEYGTAGEDVTLQVIIDYEGEQEDETLTVELGQSTEGFSDGYFSFEAKGPASIDISARLGGSWNSYGSIYLRNICFKQAVPDLAVKEILSPATSQLAVSPTPFTVAARFKNQSPFELTNPVFHYQIDNGEVVSETYDGVIGKGATIDYTFATTYTVTEPTTQVLAVWCEAEGDGNADNDRMEKTIDYYNAETFPYHSTFDEGNELWSTSGFSFGTVMDGNGVAYGSAGTLVSPAISMPAGTARVSFYYACSYGSGANLKLYIGRSPSDLTEVLFDKGIRNGGWLNGYHLLNIAEAGNYYFIFSYEGTNDQLIIDNFKVDAEEDLCMHSVDFDVESGFNLTEAKVTLGLVNHGVTTQKDFQLRYYINDLDHYVTETVSSEVAPGDTLYYTFQQPADVSETDKSYTVIGQILTVVGSDTQNDLIQGATIQNFAPYTAPYYYNFADETLNGQWTLEGDNAGWHIDGNYYAYDGGNDLQHTNYSYASTEQADNWAFSPAIVLEPGEYEVSFFHRGRTYFGGEEYQQSFEAKMGSARSAEAMTISLSRHENLDYEGCMNYKKDVARVTITEAGEYYLGFHNFSPVNDGELHIDGVSIVAVEDGQALPFESDFANGDEGWTKYNDGGSDYFVKWQLQDGAEVAVMDGGAYVEGPLVSPKLSLQANREVVVTVDYDFTTDIDGLEVNLYGAALNSPQAMQLLTSGDASSHTITYTFTTGSEPQDFYVALRTSSNIAERDYLNGSFTLSVKSVKVEYSVTDGISTATASSAAEGQLFDLQGRTVRKGAATRGLYIQNGRKQLVK